MGQKQARLKPEVLDSLSKSTKFTAAELVEWHKNFIKRIYSDFFPHGDTSIFASMVFNIFDRNKDGVIDFSEFITTLSITSRGQLDQKLKWAFKLYDLDDDQYISKSEMTIVLNSIYRMLKDIVKMPDDEATPEQRTEKIFASMDLNHDQRLSVEEFYAGVRNDPVISRMLTMNPSSLLSPAPHQPPEPMRTPRAGPSQSIAPQPRRDG